MDVKLPKLGEGADSGVVVNVFVKEGDQVAKGQAIIELENEKAVASIPATAAGVVAKIHVKPGDKVNVGQKLISLTGGGSPAASPPPTAKRAAAPAAPEPEMVEDEEENAEEPVQTATPVAAPSVRRLARELGIDLSRVRGSEPGGRIVIGDVRAYIQKLIAAAAKDKLAGGAHPASAGRPTVTESIDFSQWGPVTKKPLTPLRQVIVRRMSESWNTVPRVTQFDEADFTQLNALRKKFAAEYEKKGVRLTLTPLVLKALVGDIEETPDF